MPLSDSVKKVFYHAHTSVPVRTRSGIVINRRTFYIAVIISILCSSLFVCLLLVAAQRRRDAEPPTRPRQVSTASSNVTVRRGGNLQAAIDKAHYGDVIVLEAGATYP